MSGIANAIDFLCEGVLGKVAKDKKGKLLPQKEGHAIGARNLLIVFYVLVFIITLWTYDVANIQWKKGWHGFSFTYFAGTATQFLGFACLLLKVNIKRSVEGISSQSLVLFGISLVFRIFTTVIYDGYLPVDWSGDFMSQLMDMGTLLIIIGLLHAVHRKFVHTYQVEHDDFHIGSILLSSLTLACVVQGGLNKDYIYDAMWSFSLNVEVFQILPQLYMLTKVGGIVDHTTAHWVVNIFIACAFRYAFWLWAIPGCTELTGPEKGYSWNMNAGAYYILIAYAVESLIYFDFVYYYVRARWRGWKAGVSAPLELRAFDPTKPIEV
jgi:hypothetical protein